ncbi:MAG: HD domain-containing phosphohydrolase [Christensenellales bacterium]
MIAKRDIYDENFKLLIRKGTKVSCKVLEKLTKHGYYNPEDIISSKEAGTVTKKANIRNTERFELPNIILGDIIFESENKPWGIYVNALCNYLDWIYTHSINVSLISMKLAAELKYNYKELWNLGLGALLHDIGKLVIPKTIISKPGSLNDIEMNYVRRHCELGARTLEHFCLPKECTDVVLHHHERLDGSGYPEGLKADEISCNAKIVMIADAVDAITSGRPYRAPKKMDDAIKILKDEKGRYSFELIKLLETVLDLS